ncbi:hypothetical protein N5E15_13375 [Pantoea stewartii]|uniref:hypothetical protein n=1 Tax=Pantoea stewartii TaxID=66269 RepID=UPI0021D4BB6F|nr:hypothetical protein [Pantoea stewartii]MCU7367585.1 hypothetical protein [Pantoea stewartii]
MLRDNDRATNFVTGEALLPLLSEDTSVCNESLTARLQLFLQTDEDAYRHQAILNALKTLSIWSYFHGSPEKQANAPSKQAQIFHFSDTQH